MRKLELIIMQIINLTQEPSTLEQDVFDIPGADGEEVRHLLTFSQIPSDAELRYRANQLAALAYSHAYWNAIDEFNKLPESSVEELIATIRNTKVMIDGPTYLIPQLAMAIRSQGLVPVCSFKSNKACVCPADEYDCTTSPTKTVRHIDWVEVW